MRGVPPDSWLRHLEKHLPLARTGEDPEGVHQVRVAGRRLRVWLRLAGMRVLDDDLAWLVRSAGRVRDLEVLLGMKLPEAFLKWVRGLLQEARLELRPVLDSPRLAGLLQALSLLPPLEPGSARLRLARFSAQVERRAARWMQEGGFEPMHALRRALRRLRYAREWLGEDAREVKALQEVFGRAGDLHFTLGYLQRFEAEGGGLPRGYLGRKEVELAAAMEEARAAWLRWGSRALR
ncbi:CHAD domain-containing protein [Meiothermus sp. QL-1]|uniref:CHAD domain-containing protein n=1 Tax=Meiothermus sp. QL-1 TaxID=2058095 RepID=UPI000E0C1055|nr:CHAD domain-containing protein [Meiothermus sp. QL-1]RDI95608.1 CHAD domain-containing protein [Meiothermus sp. QL-1]